MTSTPFNVHHHGLDDAIGFAEFGNLLAVHREKIMVELEIGMAVGLIQEIEFGKQPGRRFQSVRPAEERRRRAERATERTAASCRTSGTFSRSLIASGA
jgi:hypothetical protein